LVALVVYLDAITCSEMCKETGNHLYYHLHISSRYIDLWVDIHYSCIYSGSLLPLFETVIILVFVFLHLQSSLIDLLIYWQMGLCRDRRDQNWPKQQILWLEPADVYRRKQWRHSSLRFWRLVWRQRIQVHHISYPR